MGRGWQVALSKYICNYSIVFPGKILLEDGGAQTCGFRPIALVVSLLLVSDGETSLVL